MDHDLAYRALASGGADVMDVYTTDAEIRAYELRVLDDDRQFFTRYEALSCSTARICPRARPPSSRRSSACEGPHRQRDDDRAQRPRQAGSRSRERGRRRLPRRDTSAAAVAAPREHALASIASRAAEHSALVGLSLLAAIALAVPLGVVAARRPRLGRVVVGAAGLLQTIPSLALLVLLIPLLGIGSPPAVAALFLYGLLPIVRNTHAGLVGIPESLQISARALGLPARARLRLVELPLAMPFIVAGIKTSAVIAVGTATVGRAGRRGRLRPADPDRHPPRRLRPDPAGRACPPPRWRWAWKRCSAPSSAGSSRAACDDRRRADRRARRRLTSRCGGRRGRSRRSARRRASRPRRSTRRPSRRCGWRRGRPCRCAPSRDRRR